MADVKRRRVAEPDCKVATLASISDAQVSTNGHRGTTRGLTPPPPSPPVALVTAASTSHEADRHAKPKSMLELGGQSVLHHVLTQLQAAGLRRVVVQCGHKGKILKEQVERDRAELFPDLEITFQDLGPGWRAGHAMSVMKAEDLVRSQAGQSGQFLLCPADHIYDENLIAALIGSQLEDGDLARMLVESDLEGMVGLPSHTVQVALRPLHSLDRIYHVGTDLGSYAAIDAGLCLYSMDLFERLRQMHSRVPYFTMVQVQQSAASMGALGLMQTSGRTWFSVETEGALDFSRKGLTKVGHQHKLADGRVVQLVGMPRKVQTSPSSGGDWAEFNVAKWRSAVFTTKSFFSQLYDDTTGFIRDICHGLGGRDSVFLIEVGCGTGEALQPLLGDVKYVLGMDFNPKFIDFCNANLENPQQNKDRVKFVEGDACKLGELLTREVPSWLQGTTKVVMCVGNTIGIMPAEVQMKVYQQMAEVAGRRGVAVMVFWNGNSFGEALQHFYHKNPQLCGPFTGEHLDLATCTLKTPSGYNTHWTKPEEAKQLIHSKGMKVVKIEEKGRGVLVAFRLGDSTPASPKKN